MKLGHHCSRNVQLFLKSALYGQSCLAKEGETYNYQNALQLMRSKATPTVLHSELVRVI